MPIPLPNLDDRKFADLAAETQARIVRFAPEWTNHNVADPGVMLLELFAWLTESTIYRMNRVPESSRLRFLEILGIRFAAAEPATIRVRVCASGKFQGWILPRGTVLTVSDLGAEMPARFEVLRDARLGREGDLAIGYAVVRQTELIRQQEIGVSTGEPGQLIQLPHRAIVLPVSPFPVHPVVLVDDEAWSYVPNFAASKPDDKHFTIKRWLNAVAFGNRRQGAVPAQGALLEINYRQAPIRDGAIIRELLGVGNGTENQTFRLAHPLFAPDLRPLDPFEPRVFVEDAPWQYRADVLEMEAGAAEFTVEPARNAVRLGNSYYGRIPEEGARLTATYRYTMRSGLEFRPGMRVSVVEAQKLVGMPGDLTMEIDQVIAPGRNATDIDEAHRRAMEILKRRWRAISTGDIEEIIRASDCDIARATCLPGRNLNIPDQQQSLPGHISTIVLPRVKYGIEFDVHPVPVADHSDAAGSVRTRDIASTARIDLRAFPFNRILAFAPDGERIAVASARGDCALVNLESPNVALDLGPIEADGTVVFSPTSRSLIVKRNSKAGPRLYAGATADELARLPAGASVLFSQTGALLAVYGDVDSVQLRNAQDGAPIVDLPGAGMVAAFDTKGDFLATAIPRQVDGQDLPAVQIWDTHAGAPIARFDAPHTVKQLAFSPDASLLATADSNGGMQIWWTLSGKRKHDLPSTGAVARLHFSPDGTRLAAVHDDALGLWSTRTGKRWIETGFTSTIANVRFSPDSRWIAAVGTHGLMRLWDARNGRLTVEFEHESREGTEDASIFAVFSPCGRRLITVAGGAVIRMWDLASLADSGDATHVVPTHEIVSSHAAAADDGSWVCHVDGSLLRLWDSTAMEQISTFFHDQSWGKIRELTPIPPGRFLVVTGETKRQNGKTRHTLNIWNAQHVAQVRELVDERRLVTSQHHVAGPAYTDICIAATIAPGTPRRRDEQLRQEIAAEVLYRFFHPFTGGPDGQGWPWGRDVYASEIYQLLEGVDGVDHVDSLTLSTPPHTGIPVEAGGPTSIPISPLHLVRYIVNPDAIQFTGEPLLRRQNVVYRTG